MITTAFFMATYTAIHIQKLWNNVHGESPTSSDHGRLCNEVKEFLLRQSLMGNFSWRIQWYDNACIVNLWRATEDSNLRRAVNELASLFRTSEIKANRIHFTPCSFQKNGNLDTKSNARQEFDGIQNCFITIRRFLRFLYCLTANRLFLLLLFALLHRDGSPLCLMSFSHHDFHSLAPFAASRDSPQLICCHDTTHFVPSLEQSGRVVCLICSDIRKWLRRNLWQAINCMSCRAFRQRWKVCALFWSGSTRGCIEREEIWTSQDGQYRKWGSASTKLGRMYTEGWIIRIYFFDGQRQASLCVTLFVV